MTCICRFTVFYRNANEVPRCQPPLLQGSSSFEIKLDMFSHLTAYLDLDHRAQLRLRIILSEKTLLKELFLERLGE